MVVHERLIKIPVPEFNEITTHKMNSDAFCLCYQFNLEGHAYGPYGFDTEKARVLIKKLFPNLFYYDKQNKSLIEKEKIDLRGVYFFENYENLRLDMEKYKLFIKKNELLLKKGMAINNDNKSKPKLWEAYENDKLSLPVLNDLNSMQCGFFIVNNYMPQAGKSLIFLNRNYLGLIEAVAKELNINFECFPSIESLAAW